MLWLIIGGPYLVQSIVRICSGRDGSLVCAGEVMFLSMISNVLVFRGSGYELIASEALWQMIF
jgi:hypothetical protein